MKKKLLIFLVSIVVIGGSFFYFWEIWLPAQIEKEENSQISTTSPPTLFSKSDYKIKERKDGKYIIVEKVGFSAKIPEGWKVKLEGSDYPKSEYWVNLYSPDAEIKDMLTKGCGISIFVGKSPQRYTEVNESINILKGNPNSRTPCEILFGSSQCETRFEIIKISTHQALKQIFFSKEGFGKKIKITVPLEENVVLDIITQFLPSSGIRCEKVWNQFLNETTITKQNTHNSL